MPRAAEQCDNGAGSPRGLASESIRSKICQISKHVNKSGVGGDCESVGGALGLTLKAWGRGGPGATAPGRSPVGLANSRCPATRRTDSNQGAAAPDQAGPIPAACPLKITLGNAAACGHFRHGVRSDVGVRVAGEPSYGGAYVLLSLFGKPVVDLDEYFPRLGSGPTGGHQFDG